MKWYYKLALILTLAVVILVAVHIGYLITLRATEHYPADTYLNTVVNKKALIITAHDDDAFSCSGTIAKLTANGWLVRQICFKDSKEDKQAHFERAARAERLCGYDLLDIQYRTDSGTYMPLPYDRIHDVYRRDTVLSLVAAIIDTFRPEVIFSLDDSIGGYGHPDHVFMSQLAVTYCRKHVRDSGFSIKRIYQAVYPPSMAEAILVKNSWVKQNPYVAAREMYHIKGMPLPDVAIEISEQAADKKAYMESYNAHDRRNIKKFAPTFEIYPAWLYFRIFDKEYFRVIQTDQL